MELHPESVHSHFHIRWTHKKSLDWECFPTESEASVRAGELAQPGEDFTIEEVLEDCPMRGE